MSKSVEYRIALPFSVEEFKIGHIYSVARQCSKEYLESVGGRVQVIENRESSDQDPGRHTVLHFLPCDDEGAEPLLRGICEDLFPYLREESYNNYPYTKSKYTIGEWPMHIKTKTKHVDGPDENDNIFNLSPEELEHREVVRVNIADNDAFPPDEPMYREDEDPTVVESPTNRLPLGQDWESSAEPVMTCYKLVEFPYPLLEDIFENRVQEITLERILHFYRAATAWMDEWLDLSEEEVLEYEERMRNETNEIYVPLHHENEA